MKDASGKKKTIEEAAVEILTQLGGKAHHTEIEPYILEHVKLTGETPLKSISSSMQRAKMLRPSKGQRGWWELLSYQEEVAALRAELAEKDKVIADKDLVIEGLQAEKEALRRQLEPTPSFERLATALMDHIAGHDKEDKKEARNILFGLFSKLALSPRPEVLERINKFVYEQPLPAGSDRVAEALDRQTEATKGLADAVKEAASRPSMNDNNGIVAGGNVEAKVSLTDEQAHLLAERLAPTGRTKQLK